MRPVDEERLVLMAQAGDQHAFDKLLRNYERPLFRHIYRMVHNEDAAYEALQETYMAILRSIRKLRDRKSFRPWAYGVATRTCLKARSKRARRREDYHQVEMADSSPLAESLIASREEREALFSRVKDLSPRLRSVFLLHFYEGLTLKEVALALELSIGTVKSRLAAGLSQLRISYSGVSS